MSPAFEKQLLEQVASLKPEQQQRVLDFARSIGENCGKGVAGSDLLRFAGTIDEHDLAEIRQAIEQDCERVDPNEW